MSKFIYLLLTILFFAGCAEQASKPVQDMEPFPIENSLFAEKVKVDEVFSLSKMLYKENYLFITDVRANENMIYQYSLPDLKCIYKGGTKGQSEDEFQVFPVFCYNSTDKVYIWGYTQFSVKSFGLDKLGQLTFEKEYELPISSDTYNLMHVVRDSILVVQDIFQLALKTLNLNNQQVISELKFKKDEHNESFFSENAGYMVANDSLIVYAYFFKNQIDLYGVDDMKLKKRLVGDNIAPYIVLRDPERTVYRHWGLLAGKDYFYVRCPSKWGTKEGCGIEVFDYSGHSIAKYELDYNIISFAVDENNKIIYGYNSEVYEDGFLRYHF